MEYAVKKVGHRIIHIPDDEMLRTLRLRLKSFRGVCIVASSLSTVARPMGLVALLSRHTKDRFFVALDFVYAFHQVTRKMVESCLDKNKERLNLNGCFVKMGDEEVLPIGFPTSNWLFELFASRVLDARLIEWQTKHDGHITRNCDNILATWKKNRPDVFSDLRSVFEGFNVRATPQKPKKWTEPIRFCGLAIPRHGRPFISRRKQEEMLDTALKKSQKSLNGTLQFLGAFDKLK